jgi:uncharacterized protein (DUF2336 family)
MPKVDAKRLLDYAKEKSDDSYERLTREITEIYADGGLSNIERQIANDVLLLLLQQAEIDLRVALSERLSLQEHVPLELVLRLAHDDIAVASHVLLKSKYISELDLAEVVKNKGQQHWRTIAKRENLGPTVAESLINTGDVETAITLVGNLTASLSQDNMHDLSVLALRSDRLHMPLLKRPEVSNDIALTLYMFVSQELRKKILNDYNINQQLLDKTIEGLLEELHRGGHRPWDVTEEMLNLARAFRDREEMSTGLLTRTLRRGQLPFFVALLSVWLDTEPAVFKKIIERDAGKGFALVCRSLGIVKTEFATLYLLSGAMHSKERNVDQSNLLKIIHFFDNVSMEDAKRVIKSWKVTIEEELAAERAAEEE